MTPNDATLTPAQAVLGFAAWLCSKPTHTTLTNTTPLKEIAVLFNTYCRMNLLEFPSKEWLADAFRAIEDSRVIPTCKVCLGPLDAMHIDHFPKAVFAENARQGTDAP